MLSLSGCAACPPCRDAARIVAPSDALVAPCAPLDAPGVIDTQGGLLRAYLDARAAHASCRARMQAVIEWRQAIMDAMTDDAEK